MPRKKTPQDRAVPAAAPSGEAEAPDVARDDTASPPRADFPIVGIGASAGGLAAFQAFFTNMPADADIDMAFVLVQHLAPAHTSILSELIRRYTHMQVSDVTDGMTVERNCVYVIPPNTDLAVFHGQLRLLAPVPAGRPHLPIDGFLRSLAQDQQERAIAIILSGAGSDGTLGVRAVKEVGGMVMVQAPTSAEYDSMPQSAIATGTADYILPPQEMAAQLAAYTQHALSRRGSEAALTLDTGDEALQKVYLLLRTHTHHDFVDYKRNTVLRRIERRMVIHQIETMADYARYLQQTPEEVTVLFRELLIGVTRFFRDPEAFEALKAQVIPRLFDGKRSGETVRVWVPGCSTGEEAYSIAMLLHEAASSLPTEVRVQVFATDIDPVAVETARAGVYPANIIADVPPEYLDRYFSQEDQSYRVRKVIREMVVFAEQDIILDPPFSHIDAISCRNLLIYLNADLQKRLLPLFHYALNPNGFLFLGSSETVSDSTDLFAVVNRRWKLYQRKPAINPYRVLTGAHASPTGGELAAPPARRDAAREEPRSLRALVEQNILSRYVPSAVLINEKGGVLYVHGSTGRYLEPATGEANLNIVRMARSGIRLELNTAVRRAVAQKTEIRYAGLRVREGVQTWTFNLVVGPVTPPPASGLFLVVFEEVSAAVEPVGEDGPLAPVTNKDQRIVALERELRARDEYLQTNVEELTTANEELQSANEELQSTTEEMDTSREELQSVNEELTTVNTELQKKIEELSHANDDMNNLLAGTDIGTVLVDAIGRIQRFTPSVGAIFNLIGPDVGRPLSHISTNLQGEHNLAEDARRVFATLAPREAEVQTVDGRWYFMRVLPYRTQESAIVGVVFTFVNISVQHASQERAQASELAAQAHDLAANIVATVREPVLVLDADLRVVTTNEAFRDRFGVSADETSGRLLYDLGNGQWNIPELRRLLEEILPTRSSVHDYDVTHTFEHIGTRKMRVNARELRRGAGEERLILLAIEDVTAGAE